MWKRKLAILSMVIMIGAAVLTACAPLPEPAVVQETGPVVSTGVEKASTVAEVAVATTSTSEPEPTKLPELEGLWYPLDGEPLTLDMQRAENNTEHFVIGQCIEGLFEYRGDGSIEPTGAIGFEVSEDGLVYTIDLRPEAVWSDGEPVVAQHYVDGVIRLLDPDTEAAYAWGMYDVDGAEAFNTGETSDPATVGVRAVDETTLEIRLSSAAPYFETILPFSTFYPVRLDSIEEHGDRWTEAGNYLCNGPYLLDAWDHGERVVLVKNPAYWNADAVSIEKVTLPIVQDGAVAVEMYEQGELHDTGRMGNLEEHAPRILADSVLSQELRVLPRAGVHYAGLNTLRPPTDDLRVRRALALAFDRKTFFEEMIWVPELAPLSCVIPPKIMGYQPYGSCGHTYDLEQARDLLAEAGYPGGEGFPPLQISVNYGTGNADAAEALAAMWEENLGISTEVRASYSWIEYTDYLDECNGSKEDLAACEFNAYLMGWVMDYGDAQNLFDVVFAPYSAYQYTGWESERYEELMDLAGGEYDTTQRAEYYKEADKILSEDEVAVIPIFSYQWTTLVKEGVTFEYPPFGHPAFKHWALP